MITRSLFFLSALFLFACGTSKNGTQDDGSEEKNPRTEHLPFFEDLAEGDSLFASIRKGYCFGKCPVFEMKIYNSGFVTYEGTANMDLLGTHTAWATKDQLLVFFDRANASGYFQMDDEYDNPGVSDLPETTTSLVMSGKRKSVRRRYGYPTSIVAFEKTFTELIDTLTWTPGAPRE
jgi:hypothetical protein